MNVFQFSACNESIIENVFANHGYTKKYTFYGDLAIAEYWGIKAVKETFRDVCDSWKGSVEAFTEFVMCLNHRCWMYYYFAKGKQINELPKELADTFKRLPMEKLSELYSDLYYKARDIAYETYKGADLEYFMETID